MKIGLLVLALFSIPVTGGLSVVPTFIFFVVIFWMFDPEDKGWKDEIEKLKEDK